MRLIFGLLLFAALTVSTYGQAAPAPSPEFQAIHEAIEGLKKAQKDKLDPDQIHFIKVLSEKWVAADEKQRKEVLDLAERNLKSKAQEVKNATVEALGKMTGGEKNKDGEASAKILLDEAGKKSTEDNLTYFALVIDNLGRLHSTKGLPFLLKMLKYKDWDMIAATAASFGHYKDESLDTKKTIVEDMLKCYNGAYSAANEPRATTEKARHDKVKSPMESSLKSLTGQKVDSAPAWWKWWQDTGKKAKSW